MDERETYLGEGSLLVRQVFSDGFENGVSFTVISPLIANLPCLLITSHIQRRISAAPVLTDGTPEEGCTLLGMIK